MKNVLFASLLAFIGMQAPNPLQTPNFIGSGVAVTQTGIVRIDNYTCFATQVVGGMQQTTPRICPVRVEFGEDVADNMIICRSTKLGQTCATLGKLIPTK